jgi:hypothetical protein
MQLVTTAETSSSALVGFKLLVDKVPAGAGWPTTAATEAALTLAQVEVGRAGWDEAWAVVGTATRPNATVVLKIRARLQRDRRSDLRCAGGMGRLEEVRVVMGAPCGSAFVTVKR